MSEVYTVQLGHGLGLVEESPILLDLWEADMNATDLYRVALQSGRFPNVSASRLRNLVTVGFAQRFLVDGDQPAVLLKQLKGALSKKEFEQLLFLYTCRAHAILADFVRNVYWPAYAEGKQTIANAEAREFAAAAVRNGKTTTTWSDSMIKRAGSNVTGCLADFGLLESGAKSVRKMLPFRMELQVVVILAYDLHFAGYGDNRLLNHPDWALFGLEAADVLSLLKRLALRGHFIVQAAAGVTRISWKYKCMEELVHVLAQE